MTSSPKLGGELSHPARADALAEDGASRYDRYRTALYCYCDRTGCNTVEKANSAIGGVAAQLLEQKKAESVSVYTADKAARRGIEVVLTKHEYGDRINTVDTFALQREAREKYESP